MAILQILSLPLQAPVVKVISPIVITLTNLTMAEVTCRTPCLLDLQAATEAKT
jgi:hypothetical protein